MNYFSNQWTVLMKWICFSHFRKFHSLNLCKTAYKEKGEPDLVCGRYYKIAQFRHLKDGSSNALRKLW